MDENTRKRLEELRREHSHRTPDAQALEVIRELRQRFLDLSVWCELNLPRGRALALVQTNLDQARQWACNAAVSGGEIREELRLPEDEYPRDDRLRELGHGGVPTPHG
jgi:hypothetical protein